MKEKLFILLDELVSMGCSTYTTESLNLEVTELNKKISALNSLIRATKENMDDSKYFDASSQMVDRNIEISLKKRIKSLNISIEQTEQNLEDALENERKSHNRINKLENDLKESEKLITTYQNKIASSKTSTAKMYQDLLEIEEQNLSKLESDLKIAQSKAKEINNELEILSSTKKELTEKLADEKNNLANTSKSLENEKNYFDYQEKQKDEEELNKLKRELDDLEKQKLILLTDPASLADDAKKLIVAQRWNDAISKTKELITVLKSVPYINDKNDEKLKQVIESIKAEIENKRNEINNKDYTTKDNEVITSRINYLADLTANLNSKVDKFNSLIDDIDIKMVKDLKLEIDETRKQRQIISDYLKKLTNLSKNNSSVDILASIASYQKELDAVDVLLQRELDDLDYLVNFSTDLATNCVDKLKGKIAISEKEISALEKKLSLKGHLKDTISEDNDNQKLKDLEVKLRYLENRAKFAKTPDEIYSEIDVLMGSLDFDEPYIPKKKKVKEEIVDTDSLNEETIGQENTNLDEQFIEIPEAPIETPVPKEIPVLDKTPDSIGFNDIVSFIDGN
jgi:chromosome segregation ATPase